LALNESLRYVRVKQHLELERMWAGLDCPSEIDWMVVVCYCCDVMWVTGWSRPCNSKRVIREEMLTQEGGKAIFDRLRGYMNLKTMMKYTDISEYSYIKIN